MLSNKKKGQSSQPGHPGKELERGQPRVSLSPGYESSKLAPISRGVMVSIWKAMSIHSTLIKKTKASLGFCETHQFGRGFLKAHVRELCVSSLLILLPH